MVMKRFKRSGIRRIILLFSTAILLYVMPLQASAQEMPPRPVSAFFLQNLCFGAFALSMSGGTVTVTPNGTRFATGGVILVSQGYVYFPAIFGLEGNPGTIIHPLIGPDITLSGSNGGSMVLHLGNILPGDPVIINAAPPGYLQIVVGGTLEVGNMMANPPGNYSGTFSIMFIQE